MAAPPTPVADVDEWVDARRSIMVAFSWFILFFKFLFLDLSFSLAYIVGKNKNKKRVKMSGAPD